MNKDELIPHLFRTEFSKISSVLAKTFGLGNLEIAEDIASDTFLKAMETWPYSGIPENPTGWLYTVAKNKTLNYLQRNKVFSEKISREVKDSAAKIQNSEIDLSPIHISDSQLQMLFAICHPSIPQESQIAMALRILCGFGIDEIANAFLTNKETINKRLFRAKEKLREDKIQLELPTENEIIKRLETVLTTIYLLFNEGYYSETNNNVIREELCLEAMRLNYFLIQNPKTDLPSVNALMALMCFHASRFPARKNENGELILYQEQDESLWNRELISKGIFYLKKASIGNTFTKYHLEASIAYWHTIKEDTNEKWENILQLYNRLLKMEYSPIAALNRTYALAKARGIEEGILQAEKLELHNNQFYHALLGELYKQKDKGKAVEHFQKALELAKTEKDKNNMAKKIKELQ